MFWSKWEKLSSSSSYAAVLWSKWAKLSSSSSYAAVLWSKWAKLPSLCYKVSGAFLCYKASVKVSKAFILVLHSFGQSEQSFPPDQVTLQCFGQSEQNFFVLQSFGQSDQNFLVLQSFVQSEQSILPCSTKLWSKWAKQSSSCYKALVKVRKAFFLVLESFDQSEQSCLVLQSFGQSDQSILPCATMLWPKWAKLSSWSSYAAVLWSKWAKLCPCVEMLWWGWAGLCFSAAILHSKWIKLCPCGAAFAVALAKMSKTLSACYCAESWGGRGGGEALFQICKVQCFLQTAN